MLILIDFKVNVDILFSLRLPVSVCVYVYMSSSFFFVHHLTKLFLLEL